MYRFTLVLSALFAFILQSCATDEPQNVPIEADGTHAASPSHSGPIGPISIHSEPAFVKLDSYEYTDESDGQYGTSLENRKLVLHCSTNFPDGTHIMVNTNGFVPSTKEGDMNDTYGEAVPENGKFTLILKPWNITESIEFRVFKSDQEAQILEAFGENGERIVIKDINKPEYPSVCFFKSGQVPINAELIASIKKGKPLKYEFQRVSDFSQPYERALANFAWAWKNKNWSGMAKYSQQSQNETPESMKNMFGQVQIIGFQVLESDASGGGLVKVKFKAYVKPMIAHKGIVAKYLTANIINEANGWGVNAASVTGGLY